MPKSTLKGSCVLFADDEPHYIEALMAVAEGEGAKVIVCRNASTAIQIVLSGNVDCVVIDVMMDPGKDLPGVDPQRAGLEAIKVIQAKKPHQSIVCLSVLADQKEIEHLKKTGVQFLRKAETSLETAWKIIASKITGTYSV